MFGALANLTTAFGLSGAAGLNAFIPLFAVALLARLGVVHLAAPYDVLGNTWAVVVIGVFLAIETVIDKIPAADHVNDLAQTFVRPATGAVLFAAECGVITDVHPAIFLGLGLITALGVHGVKATTRPVVNVTTGGFGAPIVSLIEDVVSVITTILAIFLPILMLVFVGFVVTVGVRRLRERKVAAAAAARSGG